MKKFRDMLTEIYNPDDKGYPDEFIKDQIFILKRQIYELSDRGYMAPFKKRNIDTHYINNALGWLNNALKELEKQQKEMGGKK